MLLKKMIAGLVALAAATSASAGAFATKQDQFDGDGVLISQTVTVYLSPSPNDAGRPGAYFIGVRTRGREIAQFTQGNWEPWRGGLYATADIFEALPPGDRSYVVLDRQLICNLTGNGKVELWAGYGTLTPENEATVEKYHALANPRIPPDHIRHMYVQQDMTKYTKYWNVLNYDCSTSG